MVRGVGYAVKKADLEAGKFYVTSFAGEDTQLIQVISSESGESEVQLGVEFVLNGGILRIGELSSAEVFTEIPNVEVRVNPWSCEGSSHDMSLARGMLLVCENDLVYLANTSRDFGWCGFSLANGKVVDAHSISFWQCFSEWSLVKVAATDAQFDERILAHFAPLDPHPESP